MKQLEKETGLSRNRIYEIKKDLGLGTRIVQQGTQVTNATILPQTSTNSNSPIMNIPEAEAFVPTHNGYIKRTIEGKSDIDIIQKLYETKQPLLIIGDTGTGKTHAVRHFCYEKKLPYMRVNFNGAMTPEDLIGQFVPNSENNGFKWVDGVLTKFVRNGGVFVVDEINSGHADILFFLHPLLDDERKLVLVQKDGEVIHAHKDFWLVATMNVDYEGTKPLNLALADRFAVLDFDYDHDIEKKLIKNSKLLAFATKIRKLYREGEISTPLSTRTLIRYEQNLVFFGTPLANMFLLNSFKSVERSAIREVFELELTKKELTAKKKVRATTNKKTP